MAQSTEILPLNSRNLCPCYLHTFENGAFSWSSYVNKSAEALPKSGVLGKCNYFEPVNLGGSEHWSIKYHNNNFVAESLISTTEAVAKDEYLFFAPGNIVQAGPTYTIHISLETQSTTCAGHLAELVLTARDTNNLPSKAKITSTLISQSSFGTKVAAAMTTAGYTACSGMASNEFSTNGNIVTISITYAPSADEIIYIGIRDVTAVPSAAEDYAKLRIHNIKVTLSDASRYPIVPLTLPRIETIVKPDKETLRGTITIKDASLYNDCIWCWSDKSAPAEKTSPNRTGLTAGWYYLKAINLTTGYTLPIEKVKVPFYQTSNSLLSNAKNIWTNAGFAKLTEQFYNSIANGMKTCVYDLFKIFIIKYLWDKGTLDPNQISMDSTGTILYNNPAPGAIQFPSAPSVAQTCITDAYKMLYQQAIASEFADYSLSPFTPFLDSDEYETTFFQESELNTGYGSNGESNLNVFVSSNMPYWNEGIPGKLDNVERECCVGAQSYIYPTYIVHNRKVWKPTSMTAETRTEPGSVLGRGNWEIAYRKNNRSTMASPKNYLALLRKKSIFAMESNMLSKQSSGEGRNTFNSYIELENLKILTPERSGKRKIV